MLKRLISDETVRSTLYLAAGMFVLAAILYATRPECRCVIGGYYADTRVDPADCDFHGLVTP